MPATTIGADREGGGCMPPLPPPLDSAVGVGGRGWCVGVGGRTVCTGVPGTAIGSSESKSAAASVVVRPASLAVGRCAAVAGAAAPAAAVVEAAAGTAEETGNGLPQLTQNFSQPRSSC